MPMGQKFYIPIFGSMLQSIHLHGWAPSQGGGLPWRWTLRYSVSVKEGKNLLLEMNDW